jgi:chorismate dehydratase
VLRSGRICYTNDLPVYAGIDAGAVPYPGALEAGVPARLNRALLDGELDLSPVSSAFFGKHAERFYLLPDICIASDGPAMSVLLVSEAPLDRLGDTVIVSPETETGRSLLRCILRRCYAAEPAFVEDPDPLMRARHSGVPVLLIGDRANDALLGCPAAHVHDLGELWRRWTGEAMVFAVWAVHRAVAESRPNEVDAAARALAASLSWGACNHPAVLSAADRAHSRPPGFYALYYRALRFEFDARARRGLVRFYREMAACGLLEQVPRLEFLRFADAVAS